MPADPRTAAPGPDTEPGKGPDKGPDKGPEGARDEVLRLERRSITHPDAARLVEEVQAEYVERYGGRDEAPIDAGEFEDGRGLFYVGYLEGEPVAMGAWRWLAELPEGVRRGPCAEVKRMYVAATHRRRGLAQRVLALLEESALSAGVATLVLETGLRQPEAIGLYRRCGYAPIPGFGYYRGSELSRCFAKELPLDVGSD